MALPRQILPQYELILPSNGKSVTFRPFIMKEEKLLLMALEDGAEITMLSAIHDVVGACTEGAIDTETSPLFDVQYAFLQIRAKSVAEVSDFVIQCGSCQHRIPTTIDISKINVERVEGHTNKIKLTDSLGVIMKYPTIRHLEALKKEEKVYRIIAECIESIYTNDENVATADETIDAVLEFIDNLPVVQFNKIQQFFETMPVLRHEHKFVCPKCSSPNRLSLEGIESFFV